MLVLYFVCFVFGVEKNDMVWISFNFFVVFVNCVFYCGVEVDFVDVEFIIGNMDVSVLVVKLV